MNFKLILDRHRLYPSDDTKYRGIKIDENLNWKLHVNDVSTELIRANAILIEISNYVNQKNY